MSEQVDRSKSNIFGVDHQMRNYALIDRVSGKSIASDLRFLNVVYGINISALDQTEVDPEGVKISGLYRGELWVALQVLRQEIIKYPPDFIERLIKQARLVSWLTTQHPSDKNKRIRVGGLVTHGGYTYFGQYFSDEPFTRQIVHHEVEHRADMDENWINDYGEDVKRWQGYNPRRYYIGNRYWDLSTPQRARFHTDGFARLYGRIDLLEDRATVAEMLMTDPEEAYKRGGKDEVLRLKVNHLKADYARRTGGRMGEQYFEDLAAGRVNEDYWRVSRFKRIFVACWSRIDYYSGAYKQTYKPIAVT